MTSLAERQRVVHSFDAASVLPGCGLGNVAVRAPTIGDEVAARLWAVNYAHKNVDAEAELDRLASTDLATVHLIAACFRKPTDHDIPAYGPAEWLLDRLTPGEVSAHLALIEEARRRDGGVSVRLDEDAAADLALALADATPADAVALLSHYSREDVVEALRVVSGLWAGLLATLVAEDAGG